MRVLAMVACASLCLACVGSGRLYEGPKRPRSEIAVIERDIRDKLRVTAIDEYETHGTRWEVVPGAHRVVIELWRSASIDQDVLPSEKAGSMSITVECTYDFDAVAGGAYWIRSRGEIERSNTMTMQTDLGSWIEDAAEPEVPIGSGECRMKRTAAF